MKLSAIKTQLEGLPQVNFLLPNGMVVQIECIGFVLD